MALGLAQRDLCVELRVLLAVYLIWNNRADQFVQQDAELFLKPFEPPLLSLPVVDGPCGPFRP
jgi:hypothetical protein